MTLFLEKMRSLLPTMLTLISIVNISNAQNSDLIEKVLDGLHLNKEGCLEEFILQKSIMDSTSESIIVIPKFSERSEDYFILDSYILIVNTQTGEIISRFYEKNTWDSDALILESIKIDSSSYNINNTKRAIGIKVKYHNNSRSDPFELVELSLFIQNGIMLERVLKKFQIHVFNGQTDGICTGEFEEHNKSIIISKNKTNGFYDLKIINKIIKSRTTKEDCESKIIERKKFIEYLKYKKGEYKGSL